ncbi:hypothetical protein ACFWIZ_23100, partial [Streptomyces sp. NPDC127044]
MQQLGEHVTGVKHAIRPKVVEVDRQHTIGKGVAVEQSAGDQASQLRLSQTTRPAQRQDQRAGTAPPFRHDAQGTFPLIIAVDEVHPLRRKFEPHN